MLCPGVETTPQRYKGIPRVPLPLPECLDTSTADIIIQSSDNTNYPVHKSILASSSQLFKDLFSLPCFSAGNVQRSELPALPLSEDAEVVRALITVLYPIPSEIPSSYNVVLALLAAAQKYDMPGIQSSIRAEVSQRNLHAPAGDEALVYAMASKNKLLPEAQTAARLTLDHPLTFEFLGENLREFEGRALSDLSSFRMSCRDSLVSCLESFLDTEKGPSKIWNGCSKICNSSSRSSIQCWISYFAEPTNTKQQKNGGPALPSWLHDLFMECIGDLKQGFFNSTPQPVKHLWEILGALKKHIQQSGGCTCSTTHALRGEKYCKKLEQQLAGALDNVSSAFTCHDIS
jgi:BTB/POZ domain